MRVYIQNDKTFKNYQTIDDYVEPFPRVGEYIDLVLPQPPYMGIKFARETCLITKIIHHLFTNEDDQFINILIRRDDE